MVLREHSELRYFLSYIGITERSPIAYSGGHYHMIQLMEEKKAEEYPELEWLLPNIKEWLKVEKSQRIVNARSEEHTSELQSRGHLVCRLLLEKKKKNKRHE